MAQINTPARRHDQILTTHEGAPAKRITPEQELRRSVMACLLWEDTFYEDGVAIAERIAELCKRVLPETMAEIAIEAREQMKLRHVPLWLLRQLAQEGTLKADTLARVIQRADELTEFLALYWKDGKTPLAAQVKKGLAKAFPKFDAYQLAKYDREGAVKLRDVLFLCHAKPKDEEQAAVWKALVEGTLAPPDTWEVALSTGKDKRETWTRLIQENKLGGLAFLRNLRNMQQAKVADSVIRQGLAHIKVGRILPFRFIAAAKYAALYEPELEAAMLRALESVEKLPGKTALVLDHSGSMDARLSGKSDLKRMDAAAGLAILLREVCEQCVVIAFSSAGGGHYGGVNKEDAVFVPARRGFALAEAFHKSMQSWGTNTESGKQLADAQGYDRIIIVTDEQSHQAISAPKGKGYVVNVAPYQRGIGYGSWVHIDGWSEAVVDYIRAYETG